MAVAGQILVLIVMVFVGVSGNLFNLVWTVHQHVKSTNIQTVGLILSVISFSNIILVIAALVFALSIFFWPDIWCVIPCPLFLRTAIYLMMTCGCISFWAIAWQSIFYCVKVVNFSSECLTSLKRNISTLINGAVLLSSLGISMFFAPLFMLEVQGTNSSVATNHSLNASSDATCPFPTFPKNINHMAYTTAVIFLICPIPLMIMLPTSLRMVAHLCAHTLALRKNKTQVQGSESYILVCKLTICLVGVYLTTLIIVSVYLIVRLIGGAITYLTLAFAFSFYCGMSFVILTASNRYLKEKLWSLFYCRKAQEQATKSQTCDTVDG